jgi:predicted glutamine amidotransferase
VVLDADADIVTRPNRSIIRQSYDARERLQTLDLPGWLNGDGFGIGVSLCAFALALLRGCAPQLSE